MNPLLVEFEIAKRYVEREEINKAFSLKALREARAARRAAPGRWGAARERRQAMESAGLSPRIGHRQMEGLPTGPIRSRPTGPTYNPTAGRGAPTGPAGPGYAPRTFSTARPNPTAGSGRTKGIHQRTVVASPTSWAGSVGQKRGRGLQLMQ